MKASRLILVATVGLAAFVLTGAGQGAAQPSGPGFTGTVSATRSFLSADGKAHVVDSRRITLHVGQTTDLRGRQEIDVSWTGAHPTGGTVADVNSGDGANEEYPFVLLECRGVDSPSAGANRLRPETCWTQTWAERFQKDNTSGYPAWRSDRYATRAQRGALVEGPDPRPAACFRPALAERWVPFVATGGAVYSGGSVGCAGMAPESANVGGAGIPSNATYGITGADGRGSAKFDVWTRDENASLGCSDTVPCALVAVPIMGISCDAYGTALPPAARPPDTVTETAAETCQANGAYQPGEANDPGKAPDRSVTGSLWWSESNWRNRITVPLTFAKTASICSVVGGERPVAIYGSVLMNELSAQWEPKFCTDAALHPFVHVQTSDEAARNLLGSGNIDAAFTSRPPAEGFARPTVQAPVALTGFAVSYSIDDAQGNTYRSLHLDARLLAKLLTQSYPANSLVRDNYPVLAGNPMNITRDPEFIALNPDLPQYTAVEAAATIMMLSTDADLAWALTSYLNADPEARAFLNGQPDPWGMVVNPNYQGIELPVASWPLLDNFTLPQSYIDSQNNPCYSYSPGPYLQLIANPSGLLTTIVQNVQFAVSNVGIACPNGDPNDVSSLKLTIQGRQPPGHRFVLGIASLSAAHRYNLQTAALQTSLAHPDLHAQFTDATGRQFVAPDDAALRKAGAELTPDAEQHTWLMDYNSLGRQPGAYPGAMPVYADVPTVGVDKDTAAHLATFLRYAAHDGEQPGAANGQLPAGYLPLTAANGLGDLAAFTGRAAAAVAAQRGQLPPLDAPPSPTVDPPSGPTPVGQPPAPGAGGGGVPVIPGGDGAGLPTPGDDSTSPPAGSGTDAPAAGTVDVRTVGSYSRLGSLTVPLALLLAALCGLVGSALRYPERTRAAVSATRGFTVRSGAAAVRGWHQVRRRQVRRHR